MTGIEPEVNPADHLWDKLEQELHYEATPNIGI